MTIAQALHWMDVDKFCEVVRDGLLKSEGGKLFVLGYFALGFEYTFNEAVNKEGLKRYESFYNTVESYFDCDRKELQRGYDSYPFKKYFGNARKIELVDSIDTDIQGFVNYCKTFSAYNTFLRKHQSESGFVDPAETLLREITEEY